MHEKLYPRKGRFDLVYGCIALRVCIASRMQKFPFHMIICLLLYSYTLFLLILHWAESDSSRLFSDFSVYISSATMSYRSYKVILECEVWTNGTSSSLGKNYGISLLVVIMHVQGKEMWLILYTRRE